MIEAFTDMIRDLFHEGGPLLYILIALTLWVSLSSKKSRADGTYLGVPKYRRMMFFIMPTRNESVVYFDREIRAEKLEAYLTRAKARWDVDITHMGVAALNIGLAENPRMNQFVVGHRMYARRGRWITFSMKRKKLNREAKLSAVKLEARDGETFRELCDRINAEIHVERSGVKTHADREFDLLNALPRPVLWFANHLIRWLDYYNILPHDAFIKHDGMYTSAFLANLGSIGMDPGYHHLYEHGTCPLFIMIGQTRDQPVVEKGEIVPGRVIPIRFSYDERIADGLTAHHGIESVVRVLSDPFTWLGCVEDDGSDAVQMWPREPHEHLDDSETSQETPQETPQEISQDAKSES